MSLMKYWYDQMTAKTEWNLQNWKTSNLNLIKQLSVFTSLQGRDFIVWIWAMVVENKNANFKN